MGRIKRNYNNNSNFLTFFMSVTFIMLSLIVILGGAFIFFSGNFNAGSSKDGKQLIEANEWDKNIPLMKQVANHLELKYDQKATAPEMEEALKEVSVEDLKDINHIALVNQQITSVPLAIEHFAGLRTINLTGNQLLDIPSFLQKENLEIIADNNILSDEYNYENQYRVYLLDIMKDDYNTMIFDTIYDETALKELAKKSLWIVADMSKGGQSISPLSEEHAFEIKFYEDIDSSGGQLSDYVDENGNILKPGVVLGEFYIKNSLESNKNARFPFELKLTNESLVPIEISKWGKNKSVMNAVIDMHNVEKIEDVTSLMLLTIKELELTEELSSWPEIINDMTNLETLSFTNYKGDKIPEVSKLKNINKINLSNLSNINLLKSIKLPENITSVDISNNKLLEIPKEITSNKNLKEINASNNNLFLLTDDNKDRYILDNNFLSDDFKNQNSVEFTGDFSKIDLSEENESIIKDIKDYTYENITIGDLDKSNFEFALLNGKNEVISEISQLKNEKTLYFGVKDVDVKNTNAFVSIPLKKLGIDDSSQITVGDDPKNVGETSGVDNNSANLENELSTVTYSAVEPVLGSDKPSIIEVNINEIAVIEKEAIKAMKENGKNLKINRVVDKYTKYSWFINTEEIETASDISLDLYFQSYDENENKDSIVLAFKYNGNNLPEGTNLTISMNDKFVSDEHYLYKQNADGEFEYVSSVLKINEEITFPITKADEYFIANLIIKDAINNPGHREKIEITPLNIILMVLAAIISFTLFWGGSKIFTKKEFATSMPKDKNYAKEYKQIQKTEKLVKSDTMEFDVITPEMVERFKQSKPGDSGINNEMFNAVENDMAVENIIIDSIDFNSMEDTNKNLNLFLHENDLDFNEKNQLRNDGKLKFEELEKHFGGKASFQRSNEKTSAEFKKNNQEKADQPPNNKTIIGDNDFDEYNLDY